MKTITSTLVAVLFFFSSGLAQINARDSGDVVIINSRVGTVIDSTERNYYLLFQDVPNFLSAVFIRLPDGSFNARITVTTSETQTVRSMEMSESSIYRYAEKIENFESMKNGTYVPNSNIPSIVIDGKTVRWSEAPVLSGEDSTRLAANNYDFDKNTSVVVTTNDGSRYSGHIIFASDSTLILWKGDGPYDSGKLENSAVDISPLEIEIISIKREGQFWSWAGYGLLAGAGTGALIGFASGDDKPGFLSFTAGTKAGILGTLLGINGAIIGGIVGAVHGIDDEFTIHKNVQTYLRILPDLKENALYPSMSPYEGRIFLSHERDELGQHNFQISSMKEPLSHAPDTSVHISRQLDISSPKFHVSIGESYQLTRSARNDISKAFTASGFGGTNNGWFGSTTYPVDVGNPFSWNIDFDYSITSSMLLGISRKILPQQEIHGMQYENEYANGTSYGLFCIYVPSPADPSMGSRSELALSAGVSYSSLSISGGSVVGTASLPNGNPFEIHTAAWGFMMQAGYDYYISTNFSLQAKFVENVIPSINIPAVTYRETYTGNIRVAVPHSVNFSGLDMSIGVRCHL